MFSTADSHYSKKISSIESQLQKHHTYYALLQRQQQIMADQYQLAWQQYKRDSLLFVQQILSAYEHETARTTYLQSLYSLESAKATMETERIQIGQMEETLLDLQLEQQEKEVVLLQNIHTSGEQVMNAINSWKLSYCIYAPINGKITFTTYWNENQFIPSGDTVCTIVPESEDNLIGKAHLPVARSGKVQVGQRVIVRFSNYPDEEFGTVEGRITSISLVPAEENYIAEISFPNGLITNYGKTLPVLQEMSATAEIVTDDLKLIERFIQPIKKIWRESIKLKS